MAVDYNLLLQNSVQNTYAFLESIYAGWFILAIALLMLAIGFVGLVYIIGNFLANDKIKAWCRIEVVEILYTPCHIVLAMDYMNVLFREGEAVAFDIYGRYVVTAMLSELSVNLEVITTQTGVFAYNPLRGFFVVGNTTKALTFDYIMKVMTISKFQEVFLRFIAVAVFPVFFTMGVILRSFFFTRKLGGLLMAISLSLFFIFPLFYIVGSVFFYKLKVEAIQKTGDLDALAIKQIYESLDGVPIFFQGKPGTNTKVDLSKLMNDATKAYGYDPVKGYTGSGSATDPFSTKNLASSLNFCKQITDTDQVADQTSQEASDWLNQLMGKNFANVNAFLIGTVDPGGDIDAASRLAFFSLFFSFLSIMATIAGVKSLSGILGGDLEIAGLTHLI
ncbi:hypothetical protein HYT84_03730 [Candidatus Micrarchaeota archaeon]|nr:hypothetical protein [Candidatus Micrarchaeota archaeon]